MVGILLPNSFGCFNPSITAMAHVLNLAPAFNTPAFINLMGANKVPMAGMAQINPKYPSTFNPRLKANPAFLNMQQKKKKTNTNETVVRVCLLFTHATLPMIYCPGHITFITHPSATPTTYNRSAKMPKGSIIPNISNPMEVASKIQFFIASLSAARSATAFSAT